MEDNNKEWTLVTYKKNKKKTNQQPKKTQEPKKTQDTYPDFIHKKSWFDEMEEEDSKLPEPLHYKCKQNDY
jgi:hypothetical protein